MIATPFPNTSVSVDRRSNILRGFIVCQAGDFTTGRGRFNTESLGAVVRLMRLAPRGLPTHFTHPTLARPDQLGLFLGRARNARLDGSNVRADLHFDRTALDVPPLSGGKPLGVYVMDLAESDPGALGASLVLEPDIALERDYAGRPVRDANGGETLPPVWTPRKLVGLDLVARGDACPDGLLGVAYQADDDDPELFAMRARHRNRLRHAAGAQDVELLRLRWRHKKRTAGLL